LLGAATLLCGLMLLFYALSLSAHAHQPLNTTLWGLLALSLVVLAIFFLIERNAAEPIIPMDLFKLKLFRSSVLVTMLASMGVFGAISYLPLYLQGVVGITASRAGLALLLLSLTWTGGSLLAGRIISRMGYRRVALVGMALLAFGYGLFVVPIVSGGIGVVLLSAVAIGIGMGLANLTTLVAVQSAASVQRIGAATSTLMLFRTFGGAFAVTLLGTVLLNQMHHGLERLGTGASLPANFTNPQNLLESATRALLPPELLPRLVDVLAHAIWCAFLTGFILMLAGVVASRFMGSSSNTVRSEEAQNER
jgi:predicted MFS family arabinose efflux permease